MQLYSVSIEGFRRIQNGEVLLGEATFLIGSNNAGKSSVLRAIEVLLSGTKKLDEADFYSEADEEGVTQVAVDNVVLTAEFRNLPVESKTWKGFKGRIFEYDVAAGRNESGLKIVYRKTFPLGKSVIIELKSKKRSLKAAYSKCKTPQSLIDAGASADDIGSLFSDLNKNISAPQKLWLDSLDELWQIDDEDVWFKNPGGIPGNVLSRLPRFLMIPVNSSEEEIVGKTGALAKTLKELFREVRSGSSNYAAAQKHLNALAKELDPTDEQSDFGKMMVELNGVLGGVFPDAKLHAVTDLSDPDAVLAPSFQIEMSSNVKTSVDRQGTGMLRSVVFGLLRYRQQWLASREIGDTPTLIIGFEEPEIYLHPSAANAMRDSIYELAGGSSQIIATTHSPFLIDLSRKPRQILNRCANDTNSIDIVPFSATDKFRELQGVDKDHVKMLLKLDDYAARMFFTKTAVLVEGDSEDLAIRQTFALLDGDVRRKLNCDFEVIRARGKGAIIGLAKYLNALGIDYRVMHDRDAGVLKAEQQNGPILAAVGDASRVVVLEECLEDILGYKAPSSNKPHAVFKHTETWNGKWANVPAAWADALRMLFPGYIP